MGKQYWLIIGAIMMGILVLFNIVRFVGPLVPALNPIFSIVGNSTNFCMFSLKPLDDYVKHFGFVLSEIIINREAAEDKNIIDEKEAITNWFRTYHICFNQTNMRDELKPLNLTAKQEWRIGLAFFHENDYEMALKIFKAAGQRGYLRALYYEGVTQIRMKNPNAAKTIFDDIISKNGDFTIQSRAWGVNIKSIPKRGLPIYEGCKSDVNEYSQKLKVKELTKPTVYLINSSMEFDLDEQAQIYLCLAINWGNDYNTSGKKTDKANATIAAQKAFAIANNNSSISLAQTTFNTMIKYNLINSSISEMLNKEGVNFNPEIFLQIYSNTAIGPFWKPRPAIDMYDQLNSEEKTMSFNDAFGMYAYYEESTVEYKCKSNTESQSFARTSSPSSGTFSIICPGINETDQKPISIPDVTYSICDKTSRERSNFCTAIVHATEKFLYCYEPNKYSIIQAVFESDTKNPHFILEFNKNGLNKPRTSDVLVTISNDFVNTKGEPRGIIFTTEKDTAILGESCISKGYSCKEYQCADYYNCIEQSGYYCSESKKVCCEGTCSELIIPLESRINRCFDNYNMPILGCSVTGGRDGDYVLWAYDSQRIYATGNDPALIRHYTFWLRTTLHPCSSEILSPQFNAQYQCETCQSGTAGDMVFCENYINIWDNNKNQRDFINTDCLLDEAKCA